jgi:Type III restriction enzyme, res subunit
VGEALVAQQLRAWQEKFVSDAIDAQSPVRLALVAPTGTGKSTVALELTRRLAQRSRQFRALLVYDLLAAGQNLLARAHTEAELPERQIDKSWLRTIAASEKSYEWPERLVAGIAARDLRDKWARDALGRLWDLVVVDDVRDVGTVCLWVEQLQAPRTVLLSSLSTPALRHLAGWTISDISAQPIDAGAGVPTSREIVEFERSPAEAALLELVEKAVALAESDDEWGATDLSRASESSPFALQAAALRLAERLRPLRNSYAHGRTADPRPTEEERRSTYSRLAAYFALLEKIIVGVDALESDARFEAFVSMVVERLAPLQEHFAVFTFDQRTAEYVADRLRFLRQSVELVRPGWSPPAPSGAATAHVVPDSALRGLDLGKVRIGVHYDAPDPTRQFVREVRLAVDAERTVISLRPTSPARASSVA